LVSATPHRCWMLPEGICCNLLIIGYLKRCMLYKPIPLPRHLPILSSESLGKARYLNMPVNVGPSDRSRSIVATSIVLPILTTIFVAIRLLVRFFVLHSLGWDDCGLQSPESSSWANVLHRYSNYHIGSVVLNNLNLLAIVLTWQQLFCAAYSVLVGLCKPVPYDLSLATSANES